MPTSRLSSLRRGRERHRNGLGWRVRELEWIDQSEAHDAHRVVNRRRRQPALWTRRQVCRCHRREAQPAVSTANALHERDALVAVAIANRLSAPLTEEVARKARRALGSLSAIATLPRAGSTLAIVADCRYSPGLMCRRSVEREVTPDAGRSDAIVPDSPRLRQRVNEEQPESPGVPGSCGSLRGRRLDPGSMTMIRSRSSSVRTPLSALPAGDRSRRPISTCTPLGPPRLVRFWRGVAFRRAPSRGARCNHPRHQ
jgi:hypothetical protein